jgi:hypothetical protein
VLRTVDDFLTTVVWRTFFCGVDSATFFETAWVCWLELILLLATQRQHHIILKIIPRTSLSLFWQDRGRYCLRSFSPCFERCLGTIKHGHDVDVWSELPLDDDKVCIAHLIYKSVSQSVFCLCVTFGRS